jgi:hypothetical protein
LPRPALASTALLGCSAWAPPPPLLAVASVLRASMETPEPPHRHAVATARQGKRVCLLIFFPSPPPSAFAGASWGDFFPWLSPPPPSPHLSRPLNHAERNHTHAHITNSMAPRNRLPSHHSLLAALHGVVAGTSVSLAVRTRPPVPAPQGSLAMQVPRRAPRVLRAVTAPVRQRPAPSAQQVRVLALEDFSLQGSVCRDGPHSCVHLCVCVCARYLWHWGLHDGCLQRAVRRWKVRNRGRDGEHVHGCVCDILAPPPSL